MSVEERSVWITLVTIPLVGAAYLAVVVPRAWSTPVDEVSWVVPMIWAFGAIVITMVVAHIMVAIATEVSAEVGVAVREARRAEAAANQGGEPTPNAAEAIAAARGARRRSTVEADERDKQIGRHGDYRASQVVTGGAFVAIVATMLGLDRFWIAHILFGAIVIGSVYGGIVKAIAYRRGL